MDTLNEFQFKQKKYIPTFPKANGKPTIYIEGYPFEDDEPMAAADFHAEQITTVYLINLISHLHRPGEVTSSLDKKGFF